MGTNYCGSQIQQNGPTVQGELQRALTPLLGARPDLKCCSRTDSGVHANAFCVSFRTEKMLDCARLPLALNTALPRDLRVLSCVRVPEDFHARYDCLGKR